MITFVKLAVSTGRSLRSWCKAEHPLLLTTDLPEGAAIFTEHEALLILLSLLHTSVVHAPHNLGFAEIA